MGRVPEAGGTPSPAVDNVWDAVLMSPRRFLCSWWPWRALAYLASGVALGVGAGAVVAVLLVSGVVLLAVVAGVGALLALALLGIPVARLERLRLRLVDAQPLPDPHLPSPRAGLRAWLRLRLHEQVTWRELGLAVLGMLGLAWVDAGLLAASVAGPVLVLTTPLYTSDPGSGAWTIAASGVLLLPVAAYLVAAWAAARVALVRAVLGPQESELGARLTEVSRSRARLLAAFERERRLIERDLHDGVQRHLVALCMELGLARLDLADGSAAGHRVDVAQGHAERALEELRSLVRGVRPRVLADRGLAAAVADLAAGMPLPVGVEVELDRRLPGEVESTAYFCLAETLANVARHSQAASASVAVRCPADLLVLEVADDGRGGVRPAPASGLTGLADRLAALGGRLTVASPPGGPTLVRCEIPVGAG